jgi:hypothetical protein
LTHHHSFIVIASSLHHRIALRIALHHRIYYCSSSLCIAYRIVYRIASSRIDYRIAYAYAYRIIIIVITHCVSHHHRWSLTIVITTPTPYVLCPTPYAHHPLTIRHRHHRHHLLCCFFAGATGSTRVLVHTPTHTYPYPYLPHHLPTPTPLLITPSPHAFTPYPLDHHPSSSSSSPHPLTLSPHLYPLTFFASAMGVSRVVVHIPHHHHLPSAYPIGYLSSFIITSHHLYPSTSTSLYSPSLLPLTPTPSTHHHLYLLPLALPSTYHHYLPTYLPTYLPSHHYLIISYPSHHSYLSLIHHSSSTPHLITPYLLPISLPLVFRNIITLAPHPLYCVPPLVYCPSHEHHHLITNRPSTHLTHH